MSKIGTDRDFVEQFILDAHEILNQLDVATFLRAAQVVADCRANGGRLFFAGSGGGAGHASHATCDFRKLAGCEAYCVTDNVSELTARINDEGWDTSYAEWLRVSGLRSNDCLIVFSVGGGSREPEISMNLVNAAAEARARGGKIIGVLGRDGGEIARLADVAILIHPVNFETVTPQTEGFQALVWHLLVSMPTVSQHSAKWESVSTAAPK